MLRNKSHISSTRPAEPAERITLSEEELYGLKIVKQAILKSAIEGGQIKKIKGIFKGEELVREETDEEFVERWLRYIYRNTKQDKEIINSSPPF